MTITVTSKEMNMISDIMIANDHYTISGLYYLVQSYNSPSLSLALDCVFEEGTIDTIINFFLINPYYYPEAVLQNTHMDIYTYPSELLNITPDSAELRKFFITSN